MTEDKAAPPIIIIKKKKGPHGHHGGAWKVAYADFVTAMMALFIVLWLLSSNEEVKKAVGGYFQDPSGSGKQIGSTMAGSGTGITVQKEDMTKLKEKLEQAMKELPNLETVQKNVMVTVTLDGLRIELLENNNGVFFDSGSAKPTQSCTELVRMLAEQLKPLPNRLLIEGHTDAKPYGGGTGYSNWELSTDRANTARRILQEEGVEPYRIAQIRGFADQMLRLPEDPENAANRRVSIIVQHMQPLGGASDKPGTESAAGQAPAGGDAAPAKGH
jgi:chemotaxis protein MotB